MILPDDRTTKASGRWIRQFDWPINVKWYGAKGDGNRWASNPLNACAGKDDHAAIEAAIDAAETRGGGIIEMPPGDYCLSDEIVLPHRVSLRGSGRGVSVLVADPNVFTFSGVKAVVRLGDTGLAFNARLEDLSIDALDIADSVGVFSSRAQETSGLERVSIANFKRYGAWFARETGGVAQNFFLRDLELYPGDLVVGNDVVGLYLDTPNSTQRGVDGLTTNTGPAGSVDMSIGIKLNGVLGPAVLQRIHLEDTEVGIDIGQETGCQGIVIQGVDYWEDSTDDKLIKIHDNQNRNLVLMGLRRGNAQYTVYDEQTGVHRTENFIAEYVVGNSYTVPNP